MYRKKSVKTVSKPRARSRSPPRRKATSPRRAKSPPRRKATTSPRARSPAKIAKRKISSPVLPPRQVKKIASPVKRATETYVVRSPRQKVFSPDCCKPRSPINPGSVIGALGGGYLGSRWGILGTTLGAVGGGYIGNELTSGRRYGDACECKD